MNMDEVYRTLSNLAGKHITWIDNAVLVTLTDGNEIYFEYIEENDELYMFGHVASIPEERFGRYALLLLEANLFGKDTGGSAVLAYDREECRVVIWDRLSLTSVTSTELQNRFSYLYLSKLHWTNKMREDLLGGDLIGKRGQTAVSLG